MPQKWITKKGSDGENRHIPIKEGNRMREREVKVPKFDKFNNVDIQEHNWGMKYLGNGHWELRLGNLSDAGWYWEGNENDMLGFLIRIGNSRVSKEFLEEMKRYGISFNDLKNILLKDLKHNDGLYEISGDNQLWKTENKYDYLYDEMDNILDEEEFEDLSDEQKEELKEKAFEYVDINFDDFEKEYGDDYKDLMKKVIENAQSFDEFFENISSYTAEEVIEDFDSYIYEQAYESLQKALNEKEE